MLQLNFWDPWLRQQELLEHIKTFLQVRAASMVSALGCRVGEPNSLPDRSLQFCSALAACTRHLVHARQIVASQLQP